MRLDVTKPQDIEAAVTTVTKAGRGLYGLVNNAGVVTTGLLIDTKPEEFDLMMQVNAYGPYLVTRAFAPLIVAHRGRIINIGSISGILNEPDAGAYQMSKHALEALQRYAGAGTGPVWRAGQHCRAGWLQIRHLQE